MTAWVPAGMLVDLWEGEVGAVTVNGADVLLCNVGGEVVAYEDRCPHLAERLSKGALDAHVLTCAAHEWAFDVLTGRGVNPASACLRRFPVRLDGDTILVNIGEPHP